MRISLLTLAAGASAFTNIEADDPGFLYSGRFDMSDPKAPSFDWSGVYIEASFSGTSLSVRFADNAYSQNLYNVFVDSELVNVIETQAGTDQLYPVTSSLADGNHSLRIQKRTEAMWGGGTFKGLQLDDGAGLGDIESRKRNMWFIGDSISCSSCSDGQIGGDFTPQSQNSNSGFASKVAMGFDADFDITCISGHGLVHNYGDPVTESADPMPVYVNHTLSTTTDPVWNFTQVPSMDVISINLGTNDFGSQPSPDPTSWIATYEDFVDRLWSIYPEAEIFLNCGPFVEPDPCTYVKTVADNKGVTYIDMQGILEDEDFGCAAHPGISGHQKMVDVMQPIIADKMGW